MSVLRLQVLIISLILFISSCERARIIEYEKQLLGEWLVVEYCNNDTLIHLNWLDDLVFLDNKHTVFPKRIDNYLKERTIIEHWSLYLKKEELYVEFHSANPFFNSVWLVDNWEEILSKEKKEMVLINNEGNCLIMRKN